MNTFLELYQACRRCGLGRVCSLRITLLAIWRARQADKKLKADLKKIQDQVTQWERAG